LITNIRLVYDNNSRIDYQYLFLSNTLYTFKIKSACASLLIKTIFKLNFSFNQALCLAKTQASLLGLLITFVNNFQINLVVMSVYFVDQMSVLNSI
jgi:hypothetical protein